MTTLADKLELCSAKTVRKGQGLPTTWHMDVSGQKVKATILGTELCFNHFLVIFCVTRVYSRL